MNYRRTDVTSVKVGNIPHGWTWETAANRVREMGGRAVERHLGTQAAMGQVLATVVTEGYPNFEKLAGEKGHPVTRAKGNRRANPNRDHSHILMLQVPGKQQLTKRETENIMEKFMLRYMRHIGTHDLSPPPKYTSGKCRIATVFIELPNAALVHSCISPPLLDAEDWTGEDGHTYYLHTIQASNRERLYKTAEQLEQERLATVRRPTAVMHPAWHWTVHSGLPPSQIWPVAPAYGGWFPPNAM